MRIRHTEVLNPKTGELWVEFTDISLEEHIKRKLNHVGLMVNGAIYDLGIGPYDFHKYAFNKAALSNARIADIKTAKDLQVKHSDIKNLIKACTTHDMLDEIAWSTFTKEKYFWFFGTSY